MEHQPVVGLTSTEIAALWASYMSESMAVCLTKYFLKTNKDAEVQPLLEKDLQNSQTILEKTRAIFTKENYPVPIGYTDKDVNPDTPPLFLNLFPLSYLYGSSRLSLHYFSTYSSSAVREDVRALFSSATTYALDMNGESTRLMLSKGVYDRPAFIPYPEHIEFMEKGNAALFPQWFGAHQPLNVLELSEIFFNIERNYFGMLFLTAFIQVVQDEKIKEYFARGKKLAGKQIEFLNEVLVKDDLLGNIMVNTEVSASTVSPFSDKLMLGIVTMTNSAAITYIGHALSSATRLDLAAEYGKTLTEIMHYGHDGMKLMIERGWMEAPPHAVDRKKLARW